MFGLVQESVAVFPLTGPESVPVAVQWPAEPGASNDINPEKESMLANPLIAPDHSAGVVPHAPSTQSAV